MDWGAVLEVLWITATQVTYREKAGKQALDTRNSTYKIPFLNLKSFMWNFQGTNLFLRGGFDPQIIAYFNKNYVATGIFDREIGRNLARLKQKREQSDYDDFFIASKEEAQKQFDNAESIVAAIIEYMRKNNSGTII